MNILVSRKKREKVSRGVRAFQNIPSLSHKTLFVVLLLFLLGGNAWAVKPACLDSDENGRIAMQDALLAMDNAAELQDSEQEGRLEDVIMTLMILTGQAVSMTDTDSDGTVDYCDQCPQDPNKTVPGNCGCGVMDVAGDSDCSGIADASFIIGGGNEMYLQLVQAESPQLKITNALTPAFIKDRLLPADGKAQIYSFSNGSGIIGDNEPITAAATLTVTPETGSDYALDYTVAVNSNPFVRLENETGGTSWHDTIQEAIDSGADNAAITLWPGTYLESIDLGQKNMTISSTDPTDEETRDATIITGAGAATITIGGNQDHSTIITGLNISGNTTDRGILIVDAGPTITKNRIAGNTSDLGAGIEVDDRTTPAGTPEILPLITENLIENNAAKRGGGIHIRPDRTAIIARNTVRFNSAEIAGGGIYVVEGGRVKNEEGDYWQAHRLPGTTSSIADIEGVEETNIISGNTRDSSSTADASQIYYRATPSGLITASVAHIGLNKIVVEGTFSSGDILRLFADASSSSELDRATFESGNSISISREVEPDSTFYVSLQHGATEVYAQSDRRQAITVATPKTAPSLIIPTDNETDVERPVVILWGESGGAEGGYRIYLGTDEGNMALLDSVPAGQWQYGLNSLEANTKYYWKVAAVDQYGATKMSDVWSFTIFTFEQGKGYEVDPYVVKTADQLDAVRNYTSTDIYFKQSADIDLSSYSNWTPIADFKGHYDGQGYRISNLNISLIQDNLGLFGNTEGAELTDIHLDNVSIQSSAYDCIPVNVGPLVGYADSTTIVDCHASGTVNAPASDNVGGLVGYSYSLSITSEIALSSSTCTVNGRYDVGGLVGDVHNKVAMRRSFATGNIVAEGTVGGLVGLYESAGKMENCYARGNVTATQSGQVGGLIGRVNAGDDISNCYSTGQVIFSEGASYTGGLIGRYYGAGLYSLYWDTQTSGMTTSDGGHGRTTDEMKNRSKFFGWNFDDIWEMGSSNDGYPYLRNNQP